MKACCLIPIWELDGLRLNNYHLAIRKTTLPCFTVELGNGGTPQVPGALLHVRGHGKIYRKENLLNLLEKQIPAEFDTIIALDAGVALLEARLDAKLDVALAGVDFVQPFSECEWIGPGGGVELRLKPYCLGGTPGIAWALKRDTWQKLGGLWAGDILGSGEFERAVTGQPTTSYAKTWIAQLPGHKWGYCPGTVVHYWHKITKRLNYEVRAKAITKLGFNPHTELVPNVYGVNECMNVVMLQYAEYCMGQVYA